MPPPEEPYGVQKVMEIRLEESGSRVHIRLKVTNIGQSPTTLAPWAPTVMAPAAWRLSRCRPKQIIRGIRAEQNTPAILRRINRTLFGPFSISPTIAGRLARAISSCGRIRRKARPRSASAIRCHGWPISIKARSLSSAFSHHEWAKYPDMGTSYQTFTNEDMLEMETVGALCTLLPGQSAELEETWELFTDVPVVKSEADMEAILKCMM